MKLKEIAQEAKSLEKEIGITLDDVLHKLTQELGEFNDAVQKYRGKYCKEKSETTDHIKEELGDLIINIASICVAVDIDPNDLNTYAEKTLSKFRERTEIYKKLYQESE